MTEECIVQVNSSGHSLERRGIIEPTTYPSGPSTHLLRSKGWAMYGMLGLILTALPELLYSPEYASSTLPSSPSSLSLSGIKIGFSNGKGGRGEILCRIELDFCFVSEQLNAKRTSGLGRPREVEARQLLDSRRHLMALSEAQAV